MKKYIVMIYLSIIIVLTLESKAKLCTLLIKQRPHKHLTVYPQFYEIRESSLR